MACPDHLDAVTTSDDTQEGGDPAAALKAAVAGADKKLSRAGDAWETANACPSKDCLVPDFWHDPPTVTVSVVQKRLKSLKGAVGFEVTVKESQGIHRDCYKTHDDVKHAADAREAARLKKEKEEREKAMQAFKDDKKKG